MRRADVCTGVTGARGAWLLLAAATCLTTPPAAAQKFFLGRCPTQDVVQNFEVSRYLGKWYEIEKYFAIFELGGRCITATYSDKGDGKIRVINEQTSVLSNEANRIEGEAEFLDPSSGEAKLFVSFVSDFLTSSDVVRGDGNYWVLDTDYDNYTLVWSCKDLGIVNAQILWILTRKQKPDPQLLQQVKNIIEQRGLDTSRLEETDQTNCT